MYTRPITIRHIFISPGHNYFGHEKNAPGNHPTHDVDQVMAKTDLGLVGDRFFGLKKGFDGQVTFFAWEVYTLLCEQFSNLSITPMLLRRNVITEGINLNALIGHEFEIHTKEGEGVRFRGARHCNPCAWMDQVVGSGALKFLKGRGGLRAQILSDGVLRSGDAMLFTSVQLDATQITEPLARPKLP
ncbi:molybdenum cofactor biosysynthesis protein [Chloroflexi bacterium TSY]|nr:molybdenum cofactor biosysynthesis protein [Chloroflexi bacterium TSY]